MSAHKKFILLKASLPFVLLAAIVVGLYFWLFAPKSYRDLVPAESRAVVMVKPSALLARDGAVGKLIVAQTGLRPEGLDESQDIYVFISPNGYFGLCSSLQDSRKLAEQIGRLAKSGQAEMLPRSNQLSWAWLKKGWLLAWSHDALLALGPGVVQEQDVLRQTMTQMFRAGSDKSFRHSDYAALLDDLEGDLRLFAHSDALPSPFSLLFRLDVPHGVTPSKVLLAGSCQLSGGGNNTGGVVFKGQMQGADDDTQALLEAYWRETPALSKPVNPFSPEEGVFYMAARSRGDELLQTLRDDANVRTMLLSLDRAIDAEALRSSGGGDILFSLVNMAGDGAAVLRLQVQRGDSVVYDELSSALPEVDPSAHIALSAAGKRAFFRLNVSELWRQKGLEEELAEKLRGFLGTARVITYEAEPAGAFTLRVE